MATLMFSNFTQAKAIRFLIPIDSNVIYQMNEGRNLPKLPREDISIFVWNMYKGKNDTWKKDYEEMTKGKDILLLQEILTTPLMKGVIANDADRTYYLATSFFDKWEDLARSGVATASEYEATEVHWQRSHYREPVVKTPKMISLVKYAMEGTDKELLTMNIHAINFVGKKKLFHMVNAALVYASKHDGPVVFGGDFNTWSKGKEKGLHKMMKEFGYKEVTYEVDGRSDNFGRPLDHIFVRDLKINSSRTWGEREGSDHYAMEVNVSYL